MSSCIAGRASGALFLHVRLLAASICQSIISTFSLERYRCDSNRASIWPFTFPFGHPKQVGNSITNTNTGTMSSLASPSGRQSTGIGHCLLACFPEEQMICALDQLRRHRSEDSASAAAAAIRSLTTFIGNTYPKVTSK